MVFRRMDKIKGRLINMKQCSKCKIIKDESTFYKDSTKKDKLASNCKQCHAKTDAIRYRRNKDSIKQYNQKYYLENKITIQEQQKRWYNENKDWYRQKEIIEYNSKYREMNRIKALIIMGGCCEQCRKIPKQLRKLHFHHIEYKNGKRDIGIRLYKRIINRNTHGLKLLCIRCHSILHKKGGYLKYQKMS